MVEKPDLPTDSILIKRYAKRRLYNTTSFTYVSLGDLADMVLRQQRFVVSGR
jgi:polyhydroxyalkanoate synthesis regulator protein